MIKRDLSTMETVQTKAVQKTQIIRPARPSFFRAETIGQKLTLGFLVILLLLTITGTVAYVELVTVGRNAQKMETSSMQAMDASHLERLSETVLIPIHDYILTGDPGAKAQFENSAAEFNATITELGGTAPAMQTSSVSNSSASQGSGMTTNSTSTMSGMSGMATAPATAVPAANNTSSGQMSSTTMADMGNTMSVPLPPEQLGLLANISTLWGNVHSSAETIFNVANPVGNMDAINQLKSLEATSQSMVAYAESIHVVQMQSVTDNQNQANATIFRTSLFLILVILVTFFLGVILSRLIGRAISRPVTQLTQISSNISMGDLDSKVDVRGGGEIGELAGAIERMRTSLKIIIERLSDEEEDLRTWTTQLASHELRRKVRGGLITLGGRKHLVGRELDGQYVFIRLDYDLREIVITPPSGEAMHLALTE